MNKLTQILATKAEEVAERRQSRTMADLDGIDAGPVRGFAAALQAKIDAGGFALIAEIKKSSRISPLDGEAFLISAISAKAPASIFACSAV